MAKVTKFSESASDSLQISASANEKGIEIIKSVADFYKAVPMTTSLNVANIFGKQHKHVLRDIKKSRLDNWILFLIDYLCNVEAESQPGTLKKNGSFRLILYSPVSF